MSWKGTLWLWSFFGEGKGHSGEKVEEDVIVALDKGVKIQL